MQNLAKTFFINIIESILQNRVAVNKKQMAQFNQVNQQIKKDRVKAYDCDLSVFLSKILLKQKFSLGQKIKLINDFQSATIIFRLVNRNSDQVIDGQIWTIQFQQFHELGQDNKQQQFEVIITLFEELLMFLNQQPLFSLYRRDTFLKKNYDLVHEIKIGEEQADKPDHNNSMILKMRQKYVMERTCGSFVMHIFCYLYPNFAELNTDYDKKPLIPSKYEEVPFKQSSSSQNSTNNRKSSVFEYYDNDLDFMFLSSQEETFNKRDTTAIDLTGYIDDDDEFEMLVAGQDEQFMTDNKNLFNDLVSMEENYFTQQHN